jgi:hypothetical protein
MDLGLHDPERPVELLRRLLGLGRGEDGDAAGNRNAELLEERLRLIFVDVHR